MFIVYCLMLIHQRVRAACTECKGGDELEEFKEYS